MKGLIIFIAVCTVIAAIPLERRAVNTEEDEERLKTQTKEICASQTPCAWSIYRPITRLVETNITNTYCECAAGTTCQINEDDYSVNAYVFKCRPQGEEKAAES